MTDSQNEHDDDHLEMYGDQRIASKDTPVPRWLLFTYIFLPLWGFFCLYYYWNGSAGWLDPGYWQQLQKAALTTLYRT